jgi:hypothetical protein
MPKLVHRTAKYCRHRASGQAIATVNGLDVYPGPYGTAVSRREYDRVIAEWLANGRPTPFDAAQHISVVELIAAYWRHAQPKAQEVLIPFLRPSREEYLFSPADAEAERREKLHAERIKNGTPLTCGTGHNGR